MAFLLKDSWIREGLSSSYRTRTTAVEHTIRAIRGIISEPRWREDSGTRPHVLCLMNPSGAGKSCTVIDAALACECLHLHVVVPSFVGIVEVVSACPSFFVHPKSDEYLSRLDVVNGFKALYRSQLAHLFASCRDAIQQESFAPSTRRVDPHSAMSLPVSGDIVEVAWCSLLASIPETGRVVLHVDDCHCIFGWHGNFPQNGDLMHGDPDDRFSRSDAPRLALRSFIDALVPYISRSRKIVWVFTGLRTNLRVFLNVPERLGCVDLSMHLQDFDAEAVYSVFSRSAALVGTPFERLDLRSRKFFERLVGPPRVTEIFLRVLHESRIRNVDEMIAREDEIIEQVAESLHRMTPGLSQASFGALKFCCIAPLLQSVNLNVNLKLNFWSNLVASGLLKVDLVQRTNPECGVDPVTNKEDGLYYNVVPAYPILQSILCSKTKTSRTLIQLLLYLTPHPSCDGRNRGNALDIALLAILTSPRRQYVDDWLSLLGISRCLEEPIRFEFSRHHTLNVMRDAVLGSCYVSSDESGGSYVVFEGVLRYVNARFDGERVCVAIHTCNHQSSDRIVPDIVAGMVNHAVDLYESTAKRSVLIVASSQVSFSEEVRLGLCSRIGESKYAHFGLNKPLPKDEEFTIDSALVSFRPYAIYFVDRDDPIWDEMTMSRDSMSGGMSDEMRMAVVQKYEPDFAREFVRNMIDGVDSSISHKRGKISLLSSVLPSMYLGGDDFLACVKDTVGDRVEISNAVAQHGLTGLSCLFPSVLQHVPDPLFTHETVELLRSLAVMYRVRNGIRNPWEVSLGAGGSDLVWYLRQWGTVERDVSAIKALLASFDRSALECLTFEALAGCDVALGSKLSVLAVVSSVEQKSWYDEQTPQNKDRGLSKRKAPSMEDVINELEGLSAISRKALDAFKVLCAENASGWCKYDVSNLYAMSHSDLENLGVSSSDAKQLLIRVDSIFDRFGSS